METCKIVEVMVAIKVKEIIMPVHYFNFTPTVGRQIRTRHSSFK